MPDDAGERPTSSTVQVTCGAVRERDPAVFSGTADTDVDDWLSSYERVSNHNKWDDRTKLTKVIFYLAGVAHLWFRNHEATIATWNDFKTAFAEVFGRPAVRKLRAEQRLRHRAQQPGETFTSYIEDVIDLCNRVSRTMTEEDKIKEILKGIEDDAFQMLMAKNPTTVAAVVTYCQSFDELRRQRALARQTVPQVASLSSLVTAHGQADDGSLLPQIKAFIREEVARQLSLLPLTQEPVQPLSSAVQQAIREQVAEALPPVQQIAAPAQIAAPLTYAEVVSRPRPTTLPYSAPPPRPALLPVPQMPPQYFRPQDPWRTRDNRPICFSCGIAGHVARFCRRRLPRQDVVVEPQVPASHQHADSNPSPNFWTGRQNFSPRRSPSPRRRSISPMRRRPPSNEGN